MTTQLNLTVTTEAAQPAIDLEHLQEQLRVDTADEDQLFDVYVHSVTDQLEAYLGLSLIRKTYRWVLDAFVSSRSEIDDFWFTETPRGYPRQETTLVLPRAPLVSVSSLQYKDTANALQTLDASSYQIDTLRAPARIKPAEGQLWPQTGRDFNAVQINFIAGYGTEPDDVPPRIRHALSMLIGHFYNNREATAAIRIDSVPLGWKTLVDDYRVNHYA